MRKTIEISTLSLLGVLAAAGAAHAGVVPAPLLGAGLPGLAVLAVAGGGYLLVKRMRKPD